MEEYFLLATFHSTYLALEFERLLKKNDLNVDLISIPGDISASCGLSARFDEKDLDEVRGISEKNHLELENIYRVYNDERKPEVLS